MQDASKAIWVGNVPEGTKFQELLALAKEVGEPRWAEVFRTTAAVGFASPELACECLAKLNGLTFKGSQLVADKWVRVQKPDEQDENGGDKSGQSASDTPSTKTSGSPKTVTRAWKGWGRSGQYTGWPIREPSKTIWIGNLPAGLKFQQLLEVSKKHGDAKWAAVYQKSAAVGYATEVDAKAAIVALNGTTLAGNVILADAYSRGSKKEI